jgi:lipoate-protein ligase A
VSRGLDLAQLDDAPSGPAKALNATGIDNALDALTLTSGDSSKVEKHPERRYKAAYAAFEERRLAEMEEDGSGAGLRQNQKKERIRKEFEKPFNNVSVAYDATKEEIAAIREGEKKKIEDRLGN